MRDQDDSCMLDDLASDTSVGARFSKKSTAGRGDTLPDPALEVSPDVLQLPIRARLIKNQDAEVLVAAVTLAP